MNELSKVEQMPVAISPMQLLQSAVAGGLTKENADAIKTLSELAMQWKQVEAEQAFAAAMVEFQKRCPIISATSVIPNRGKYERFEDIMRKISPILSEVGLNVKFSQELKDNRVTETCHLSHGSVTKSNSFTVRVSGKSDTETQGDCKASTTAKRNALCNALNIVIQQDCLDEEHDASIEGGPITAAQAAELRRLVAFTRSDEPKMLKFAQAKSYEEIKKSMFGQVLAILKDREAIIKAEQKQ